MPVVPCLASESRPAITAGDHGRRSHGEVTKKSIRPKLESRPLAPYLRPILTDHKWGNKIRFLKSRAGPTVTPSPSPGPESEPASETRNCTPRPELEGMTGSFYQSFRFEPTRFLLTLPLVRLLSRQAPHKYRRYASSLRYLATPLHACLCWGLGTRAP